MLTNIKTNRLLTAIKESKEYLALMNKTQVLNDRKLQSTANRGTHTNEVADVSKRIIEALQDIGIREDSEGKELNPKLAELMGIAHDLGHTPYGHDGEAKINKCIEASEASEEYLQKRRENFGDKYEDEQQAKFEKEKSKNPNKKRSMQFEHNEHSAEVFLKICEEQGIDKSEVQEVVTGILAHSTSRVKKLPTGVEQQAVRLADKIAYINRDIDDMLNEGILTMDDIPEDLKEFASMTPEERVTLCIQEAVQEYQKEGVISGGSRELAEMKKIKGEILIEGKNIAKQSGKESEIVKKLLETLPQKKKDELLKKWKTKGTGKAIEDVLKTAKKEDRLKVLSEYDPERVKSIIEKEEAIVKTREEMARKYPIMEKCYKLKDATDSAIFEKDENGIARIGNNVEKTQEQIGALYNYYMEHQEEIPKTEYPGHTIEEQVAFYIASLDNVAIQNVYEELPQQLKTDNKSANQEKPKIGIEQDEISPTNDNLIAKVGDEVDFEENLANEEKSINSPANKEEQPPIAQDFKERAKNIACTRIAREINTTQGEIKDSIKGKSNLQENVNTETNER